MIEDLIALTNSEPYQSNNGQIRIGKSFIAPWERPQANFKLEIWEDDLPDTLPTIWELICDRLHYQQSYPKAVITGTKFKLLTNHPLLWLDEVYITIKSGTNQVSALMGDLFIEHGKQCGNWVDFGRLYRSLPETLVTLRENQLAIPVPLAKACLDTLAKYGVDYQMNAEEKFHDNYKLLFLSNDNNWPDEENFGQSYIIAGEFAANLIT